MTNIAALEAQLAQLQAMITKEKGKEDARTQLSALAQKLGYEVEELFAPAPTPAVEAVRRGRKPRDPNAAPKVARDPVAPKYRSKDDPSQTWSGRGRRPEWVNTLLSEGGSLTEVLIQA